MNRLSVKPKFGKFLAELPLHVMILPGLIMLVLFSFIPLPAGIVMAFQNFRPILSFENSPWVGLDNFRFIFRMPEFQRAMMNTITISFMKIIFGIVVPLVLALLINEVTKNWFKRSVQTIMFLPFFLSWAVLGGIVREVFSLTGPVNQIITLFGGEDIHFFADNSWFRFILVSTDVWKGMGYNTVIFLAAITGIDLAQYEAAEVDGCGKFKQAWHITIPGILPMILLLSLLSIGNLFNAGFEQVFILYNPLVYEGGDIIDTLVYRLGMVNRQYSASAAVGLFKSGVSLVLVGIGYWSAYKFTDYRIF